MSYVRALLDWVFWWRRTPAKCGETLTGIPIFQEGSDPIEDRFEIFVSE